MSDIFINYRTEDGDKTARTIDRELSGRFGTTRVFLASKSIQLGRRFDEDLLVNARRCAVLIAVVGPNWATSADLHDPADWVRREILEAHRSGNLVIPVLDGRKVDRLRPSDLPRDLRWFAMGQSYRLDEHNMERDLRTLGDKLCELVPDLCRNDGDKAGTTAPAPPVNSAGDVYGTAFVGSTVDGDAGTVVKGNSGPVNTGSGSLVTNSPHFAGGNVNYVAGAQQGNLNQASDVPPSMPSQE
ncbi:toll/interleukin-1 receptor domain-containing protein [Frankia sp. EI5c]|uniref:toll/interleukin-1 receptor domain-containing protein n=1 Tax=Frankia sp. EI5c TaxID=683316 RepID=UPI0008241B63|nr:toll/interleukin-1 receptor domain-containing protein [Frankia sp. EI5c]